MQPSESQASSFLGRQFLHYRVSERLGAGGMGVVYKAVDQKLERNVALKFLPPYLHADPDLKLRLAREAKAASALDHPNVGTVYGIEETEDGQLFIVLAYYEGETLAEVIRRRQPVPSVAVHFASQILQGLAEAHSKGVIHRDVKPSNVLVTRSGVAKLLDFGLAKIAGATALTQPGATHGTAAYMSPEQAMGKETDARSDLWSTGVVIYEMLTGQLPFPGTNVPAMLYGIVHEEAQAAEDLPSGLNAFLSRALAKDPSDRYQNASEMLHALRASEAGVTEGSPTQTIAVPAIASVGVVSVRRKRLGSRWLLPGAVTLALAAIGGFVMSPGIRERAAGALTGGISVRKLVVLPFRNIGDDPSTAAVSDGFQEILSSRLASLPNSQQSIWVIPASEIRRRQVASPADAHRLLEATVAVEGTVMKSGQRIQLTVNLIDGATLRTIGSTIVSDPAGDLSSLEDQAVRRLSELLKLQETPGESGNRPSATVPAAYESYVKGTGLLARYDKPESLDAALTEFGSAIKRDPRFALAYAGLAEASRLKYRLDRDPKWLQSATVNATQAIELNDQLAPAYITLGHIHEGSGHPELAMQQFQTALRLDPRNADAILGLAAAHERVGRNKEAEELFKKAIDLRPDFWEGHSRLATFYVRQSRFPEADAEYRTAVKLASDNAILLSNYGVLLYNRGKRDDARQMLRKSLAIRPSYSTYSNLASLELEDRRYAEAAAMYETALRMNDKDYHVWANLASAYNWSSGWDAKARNTLQRAVDMAEKEREARPNDAKIVSDLATYHAKLGHLEQAMERIRQARALATGDVDVRFWISEAYEEMHMRKEALAELEHAFRLGLSIDRVKGDPEFRDLEKTNEFGAIVRKFQTEPGR